MVRDTTMAIVQSYFVMMDDNKRLLFNAMNEEQYKRAKAFENHLDSILKDLYAPLPTNA